MSDELTAEERAQAMVSRWIGTYTTTNAGTVQHMMVEVETVAEIAAAIRDAETRQMERDCAAVCECCEKGQAVEMSYYEYRHPNNTCHASDIRAAHADRQKEGAE